MIPDYSKILGVGAEVGMITHLLRYHTALMLHIV